MLKLIKPTLLALLVLEISSIFVMICVFNRFIANSKNLASTALLSQQAKKARENRVVLPEKNNLSSALPGKFLIQGVPFTTQSPDSLWDEWGEEACEEASMMIVDYFWKKKEFTAQTALTERNRLIQYEIENYGDFRDEDAQKIAQRIKTYFGYSQVEVIYDFSLDNLKRKIVEGRPIIVPAAGRRLKNPNFKQPGPLYHNLVIVGYEGNEIITNDPGTRKGEGYRYNENILYNAIHDFPGSKEQIEQGRKAMIIVKGFVQNPKP